MVLLVVSKPAVVYSPTSVNSCWGDSRRPLRGWRRRCRQADSEVSLGSGSGLGGGGRGKKLLAWGGGGRSYKNERWGGGKKSTSNAGGG